jgi:hypothetical protein
MRSVGTSFRPRSLTVGLVLLCVSIDYIFFKINIVHINVFDVSLTDSFIMKSSCLC